MPAKLPYRKGWAVDREQLAWAAGFIDGEGSFYVQKVSSRARPNRPLRPRFEIGQVDTRVLYRLQSALPFGARVMGPYCNKTHPGSKAQPMYLYYVDGFKDVQALLALVWPWLGIVKREQAKKVLQPQRSVA